MVEELVRGETRQGPPSAVTLVVGGHMPRRQRRRLEQAARLRARQSDSRLRVVYDTRGPTVRLGLIWVGLLAGVLWLGGGALAVLFAALAAVASLQTAQAWRGVAIRPRPARPLCAAIGAVCPLAALGGAGGLGLAVVGSVVVCVAGGVVVARRARGTRAPGAQGIGFASTTLRCGFFAGLAAGCVVLVHGIDAGAALVLVVLVCAYEVGDFLVGSGSTTAVEGPAAGCIGVLVATFAISVLRSDLFGGADPLWAMAVATALACPLGQLAASALLPSGGAFAPALRRLDSYLLAAPLWALVLLAGWLDVHPSLP